MEEQIDAEQVFQQILQHEKARNLEQIRRDMLQGLAEERAEQDAFEQRLYQRWKKALDLFETVLILGRQVGAEYNQQVRPYAATKRDLVFEVLARNHARACQLTSAILALLKSGNAEDALARARTLHELHVIARFISARGNKVAEQYLLYGTVESLKAAKEYAEHQVQLGLEPLDPEAIPTLEKRVEQYRTKFSEEFGKVVHRGHCGWAAEALNKRHSTFEDLEEAVGLAFMRPYYQMASYPIHSNAQGLSFDLGGIGDKNVLPAGPSNAGLADPGSMALTSFLGCTVLLLLCPQYADEPDLRVLLVKVLVARDALQEFVDEARQAFLASHQQLVKEELLIQAAEKKQQSSKG